MIDKLSLTCFSLPDREYLEEKGTIIEDPYRTRLFKYLCKLDKATVLFHPHKFSDLTNHMIAQTKIDLNPKYFDSYSDMLSYIFMLFDFFSIGAEDFNLTRADIAADLEDFPIDLILSTLRIKGIRSDNLSLYKGTLYAGSNPKIRIYEKVKEIKARMKEGKDITDYERGLVASGKSHTRFEIQIKVRGKTLRNLKSEALGLASYFDRLEVFDFPQNDGNGVLQVLSKYINRKFRNELEEYRNYALVEKIKAQYRDGVQNWFKLPVDES
ncbi:MAG TPA: hypothetical protein VF790_00260 [Dissulfurispiraceae bacterium]